MVVVVTLVPEVNFLSIPFWEMKMLCHWCNFTTWLLVVMFYKQNTKYISAFWLQGKAVCVVFFLMRCVYRSTARTYSPLTFEQLLHSWFKVFGCQDMLIPPFLQLKTHSRDQILNFQWSFYWEGLALYWHISLFPPWEIMKYSMPLFHTMGLLMKHNWSKWKHK